MSAVQTTNCHLQANFPKSMACTNYLGKFSWKTWCVNKDRASITRKYTVPHFTKAPSRKFFRGCICPSVCISRDEHHHPCLNEVSSFETVRTKLLTDEMLCNLITIQCIDQTSQVSHCGDTSVSIFYLLAFVYMLS